MSTSGNTAAVFFVWRVLPPTFEEYESLERALPMFDLDADGIISAYEISRLAAQAGVPDHAIPTLIRSLRMGPAGRATTV